MIETDARAVLSEMTDITGRTIDETFHRHVDLEALYRECPTAFWLAPDGDEALPTPLPGPAMPAHATPVVDQPEETPRDSATVIGLSNGILRAMMVAGPTFAASGLMFSHTAIDRNWWQPFGRALMSLIAFPFTIPFGALLALIPVLIGVLALGQTGTRLPGARKPVAWALTGGAMGIVISAMCDAGGTVALALVATSIACACIARSAVHWNEPEYG